MTDLNALREQAAEAARKYQEELARAQREGTGRIRDYVDALNELYEEAQSFAQSIDMSIEFVGYEDKFRAGYESQDWNSSNC